MPSRTSAARHDGPAGAGYGARVRPGRPAWRSRGEPPGAQRGFDCHESVGESVHEPGGCRRGPCRQRDAAAATRARCRPGRTAGVASAQRRRRCASLRTRQPRWGAGTARPAPPRRSGSSCRWSRIRSPRTHESRAVTYVAATADPFLERRVAEAGMSLCHAPNGTTVVIRDHAWPGSAAHADHGRSRTP